MVTPAVSVNAVKRAQTIVVIVAAPPGIIARVVRKTIMSLLAARSLQKRYPFFHHCPAMSDILQEKSVIGDLRGLRHKL